MFYIFRKNVAFKEYWHRVSDANVMTHTGVQIIRYIANFGDRDIYWRLMQQTLAIVTRKINTVHAQNSSLDI